MYVFDGSDEGILLEVAPDPNTWPRIQEAWDKFAGFIASKTPPPLSNGDVRERSDDEWATAAAHYAETKLLADDAQNALIEAKDRLVALASHTCETGGRVTVTRYWKSGVIDYKKVRELMGVDLEQYRGAARQEVRVTMT